MYMYNVGIDMTKKARHNAVSRMRRTMAAIFNLTVLVGRT